MGKKVLIVGGVAGGASTAARLRRLDEGAEIIMFERDEYISFANCGLPYYLGGVIENRSSLFVQTPQKMKAEFNVDVRIFSEVTAVDSANKTVTVNSRERGIYQESYDVLVLTPGAKALKPPIPGIEHEKILTLRNVADTYAIENWLKQPAVRRVAVIGGGFIGVEVAENLRHKGLSVTLVEAVEHIMAPFDSDMAVLLEREMEEQGVRMILGDGVKAFRELGNKGLEVELGSGRKIEADLVILAIGVSPDTGFLKDSGLAMGPKGHLVVNEHMLTSDPSIYAVGDAVEIVDFVNGQKTAIPLAGPANLQGRIAADNIAGRDSRYQGAVGSSIIKIFNLTAAAVGNNEKTLKRIGRSYKVAYAHPQAHASYYPGALPMALKLIYDDNGQVLGAQGIGPEGVDKRLDVIAAVIKLKGKVSDLADLELCYAPPFSSAKDPVNIVAYVAENALNNIFNPISYEEFLSLDRTKLTILDVRFEMEYNLNHLDGAINIPLEQIRERLHELDKEKPIVVYCKIGRRSYMAARILAHHGFQNVRSIVGGYTTISVQGFKPSDREPDSNEPEADLGGDQGGSQHFDHHLDASGLSCPGPLMQVKARMDEIAPGEILKVTASDPGFYSDVASWSTATKNELISREKGKSIIAFIRKAKGANVPAEKAPVSAVSNEQKTIVLFSNDLDRVLATLIIANGALAMNKKVTIFFTFWGLAVLRKPNPPTIAKNFIEKMFGFMLPRSVNKLALSKMNMLGLGANMMQGLMRDKNVPSVQELLDSLIAGGAELVACHMSMDIMGFRPEELIDGVSIGGVGYYLGQADQANMNLFI